MQGTVTTSVTIENNWVGPFRSSNFFPYSTEKFRFRYWGRKMKSNATSSSPLVECSDRQCNRSLKDLFRKDSCFWCVTCRGREPGCFSSELESFSADTTSVTTSTQKPTTHNCFKGTFSFKHYKVKKVSTRRLCTVSGMTWWSAQLAPRQHKKKKK